jgi:hypothetical protein
MTWWLPVRQSENYAEPLHAMIRDLHTGVFVRKDRYHQADVEAFLKTKLVTLDGPYFRLTSRGRELAVWLQGI